MYLYLISTNNKYLYVLISSLTDAVLDCTQFKFTQYYQFGASNAQIPDNLLCFLFLNVVVLNFWCWLDSGRWYRLASIDTSTIPLLADPPTPKLSCKSGPSLFNMSLSSTCAWTKSFVFGNICRNSHTHHVRIANDNDKMSCLVSQAIYVKTSAF